MTELVVATVTTGIAMASTPVVRGALSAGTGIYYGTTGYKALKNRKKNKILKKKSAEREKKIDMMIREKELKEVKKSYYEQWRKRLRQLDAAEAMGNKFVKKRIFKSWKIKTRNLVTVRKATLIQKIVRGYQQRRKYKRRLHTRRVWARHFTPLDLEVARMMETDSDSDSDDFLEIDSEAASRIQKIYRGYQQRKKYLNYLSLMEDLKEDPQHQIDNIYDGELIFKTNICQYGNECICIKMWYCSDINDHRDMEVHCQI